MAITAQYIGEGRSIPYTPSGSALSAGDVVDLGDLVGIAATDIADGEQGTLLIEGEFYVPKKGSPAETWTQGEKLFWDVGTTAFTDTSSYSEAVAGVASRAAESSDTYGYIKLTPGVSRS